ncbi:carboxylesterase-like protein [Cercophora scortea]|uniref:Carboxylic ester hydrolase n=1 Tax=Cercophora scortea TaxID=314031 RepID=A0AAE0IL45_9PEZI|nr:carboxylesterase-like protein [Cercophora scortea]
MATFAHPVIGQVVGKEADKCTQFLGIKYATLRDRFAVAELLRHDGSGIDATKYGPQVISPEQGVDIELGFIQQSLPKPEFPGLSEVDGLNLNITVPGSVTDAQPTKSLPVVVFIHGGGFNIGSNWWPQSDFAALVRLSTELGKPMIGININYRLGALGFLTSPELRAAGYKPNNGLRDQKTALRWIRENISGFGGNPDDITVMGQSAGAAMDLLGLQNTPSAGMVERLLELPVHDLFTKMTPAVPFLPTVDGDIIPRPFTFDTFASETAHMKSRQWIERVLLVYSKLDASIMAYAGLLPRKNGIAAAFRASATKSLQDHPEALASLLEQYSLGTSPPTTDDEALMNILRLMSDVAFFLPTVDFANKFANRTFVVVFNEPNPWDGLFKGHASHLLDVAFLFQNFNASLKDVQRAGAVAFGEDTIAYVNGETPWKVDVSDDGERSIGAYADGKRLGPGEEGTQQEMHRRHLVLGLARDNGGPGLDALVRVVTDFMSG